MKRTLYALPAVAVCFLYGMLALLAGGFASFQLKAWLIVLGPLVSAVLLVKNRWWGGLVGAGAGAALLVLGLTGEGALLETILGGFFTAYYLSMACICLYTNRKNNS